MAEHVLKLNISTSGEAEISEMIQLLLKELTEVPLEVVNLFIRRLDSLSEFICIDWDSCIALSTGECRIKLKFSDAFLELVAALRAGNFNHV